MWIVPTQTASLLLGTPKKRSAYSIQVSFNYRIYASSKIKFSPPPPSLLPMFSLLYFYEEVINFFLPLLSDIFCA
jgi:hypothetical protein